MRVPSVPLPSISLNPLPGVQFRTPQTGALSGLVQNLGEMSNVREVASNLRIEESLNKLQAARSDLQVEATAKLGGNVLPSEDKSFVDHYMGKFEKQAYEIGSQFSSKQQQILFQKRASLIGMSFKNVLNAHEQEQMKVYADGVDRGTIETESRNAAQNINSLKDLSLGLMRISAALDSLAFRNGWAPETKAFELRKAMGQFHTYVLGSALQAGKFDYAKTYMEQHVDQVTPEIQKEINGYIEDQTRFHHVDEAVDSVDAAPLNYADKAQRLRDIFKEDEKGQREAIAELHARKQQRDIARGENIGEIWDMKTGLNGQVRMSVRDIMKTPAWMELSGTERKNLARDFEMDERRNEGHESPGEAVTKYATYLRVLDDPESLVKASDRWISGKYTSVLGEVLTKKLLDHKRDIANDSDKLRTAKLDNTQFKDVAREYGLNVDGKLSKEDQAKLGSLRDQVLDTIRAKQIQRGKMLEQDDKEAVIRGLLKQIPTRVKRSWFNLAGWTGSDYSIDERFAFQVSSAADLDATDEEKAKAYEYLARNGAQTTPANMWAMIQALRGVQR